MPEEYEVLVEILDKFRCDKKELETRIEQERQSVREADVYAAELTDSETEDFKVFSPRKAEVIYREELEKIRQKKADCEKEIQSLTLCRDVLAGYTDRLEKLLEYLKQDFWFQAEKAGDLQKDSMKELTYLIKKIETVCADMERKPLQAKQDLAVTAGSLRKIAEKIEHTVWIKTK